jgi:class 3 adenylate cyclase
MSREPLTILFADVTDSASLFEQRGDEFARETILGMLTLCADSVHRHQGQVVKTIGDEIMATFPTVSHGIRAAVEMQQGITDNTQFHRERVGLRIGLHHGQVLLEDGGDVFGAAVNTAARMVGLAHRGQIVTTAASLHGLVPCTDIASRNLGKVHIAGSREPVDVVDVTWQEDTGNTTSFQGLDELEDIPGNTRLILRYAGGVTELRDTSPPLVLGRDPLRDVRVDAEWVSRTHATIEFRRGFFVLSDASTNGTFVLMGDNDATRLHHDELLLRNKGSISLGQSHDADLSLVLNFECH